MNDSSFDPAPSTESPNPYAPPAASAKRGEPNVPSLAVFAFLGAQIISLASYAAVFAEALPPSFVLLQGLASLGAMVIGLFWLRRQWARLPARLQTVKNDGVTPGQAAFRNLIPFYNLYWMFVVNAALCDGIDALLLKKQRPRAAPTALSTVCPLTLLAMRPVETFLGGWPTLAVLGVVSVLWTAYMIGVEQAMNEAKRKRSA